MTDTKKSSTSTLTLLALGVVYGDIGTSPLYAVKETFNPLHGIPFSTSAVYGGLSAIFWSLMLVVSIKYIAIVLRADNKGEGGVIALTALAAAALRENSRRRAAALVLGIVGAALFYGDAVLTPAISVLSATEGLEVATAAFKPYVVPIAVIVLILLFALQRHGTAIIGTFFGPICALWFLALAAIGIANIYAHPGILSAIDPRHAFGFVTGHGYASLVVLGAVLLAVTGAEALYADMGHFGKKPIRIAWFGLVFPALLLNYFGQGALLISDPSAVINPFFLAAPEWALYPVIALATAATVIASQATISGAFSITKQAIQLGFLPRMTIRHTSDQEIGQIYLPALNWILLLVVLAAVLGFGSSSNLASAYGVAVIGTMLVTTCLALVVAVKVWHYPVALCVTVAALFLVIDGAFFFASLLKVADGGWFPLLLGTAVMVIMLTWRRGRAILLEHVRSSSAPLDSVLESLRLNPPQRVAGTAVFMTAAPEATPHAFLHNLAHNKVLHERVVFLSVSVSDVPHVAVSDRLNLESLGNNCWRVMVYFGFKAATDVPAALLLCHERGLTFDLLETSFFLSREAVVATPNGLGMALWRERLFSTMARNATSAVEYFNIPSNRVIELGTRIEI